MLENCIGGGTDWILGRDLGLADIAIWRLMGWLTSERVDGIPRDIISTFPRILRVCQAVDGHPRIQEWVSKTYPKDYVRGHYN